MVDITGVSETVKLATRHANPLLASLECCDSLEINGCRHAESLGC